MAKKTLIFWLLLGSIIPYGIDCNPQKTSYDLSFCQRYDNPRDIGSYIFVPDGGGCFYLVNNLYVRAIYLRQFQKDYPDYSQFLFAIINRTCKIESDSLFSAPLQIDKLPEKSFKKIKEKYLNYIDPCDIRIRPEYRSQWLSIAKSCFDEGLFIYVNDYSGECSFSTELILAPEELPSTSLTIW